MMRTLEIELYEDKQLNLSPVVSEVVQGDVVPVLH